MSARSRTRRIKVVPSYHPPPDPTHAFGFVLDYDCRRRWAQYYLDEADKEEPDTHTYTPEEREGLLTCAMFVINSVLPGRVYGAIPDLPRVRYDLLPVKDKDFNYPCWVFAFRDNSTSARLHSPITKEHIDAVRKELGLADDQEPKWFRVDVFWPTARSVMYRHLPCRIGRTYGCGERVDHYTVLGWNVCIPDSKARALETSTICLKFNPLT